MAKRGFKWANPGCCCGGKTVPCENCRGGRAPESLLFTHSGFSGDMGLGDCHDFSPLNGDWVGEYVGDCTWEYRGPWQRDWVYEFESPPCSFSGCWWTRQIITVWLRLTDGPNIYLELQRHRLEGYGTFETCDFDGTGEPPSPPSVLYEYNGAGHGILLAGPEDDLPDCMDLDEAINYTAGSPLSSTTLALRVRTI